MMPTKASPSAILSLSREQSEQIVALHIAARAAALKLDDKVVEFESELQSRLIGRVCVVSGRLETEHFRTNVGFEHIPTDRTVTNEVFVVQGVYYESEEYFSGDDRLSPVVVATYKTALDRRQRGGDVSFRLTNIWKIEVVDD